MSAPTAWNPAPTALVVDDEPDLCTLYELTLLRQGWEVRTAANLAQARAQLAAQRFDVLITDMRLPDGLGLELLQELHAAARPERTIVITAYGSAEQAVQVLKLGACDYLTKPVDLRQFRNVTTSALELARATVATAGTGAEAAATALTAQVPQTPQGSLGTFSGGWAATAADAGQKAKTHQKEPKTPKTIAPAAIATTPAPAAHVPPEAASALARLVGASAAMQQVRERISRAALGMAPVLIHGESGTGKELVARALHACSQRHAGPFVAVNCGAIPEHLLEAEFFGARKGAYTGAVADREGFFQAASGGTLFLDEIGELPLSMQAKLLRSIQERSVRALGAVQEEAVNVRILSATHRDLAADVQNGRFRQDLYYRLNVIDLTLPPLRERRGDIPDLCHALIAKMAQDYFPSENIESVVERTLTSDIVAHIQNLPLPGNVRELENILQRILTLGAEGLPDYVQSPAPSDVAWAAKPALRRTSPHDAQSEKTMPTAPAPQPLLSWLDGVERRVLEQTIAAQPHGGLGDVAMALGLSPVQLQLRMQRLNIVAPAHWR